jgi:hypothetical protein
MALPRNEAQEETKPPCSVCGKPSLWGGFWGRLLCGSCWAGWKAVVDEQIKVRGYPSDAGEMFEQWFATAKVKGRAA